MTCLPLLPPWKPALLPGAAFIQRAGVVFLSFSTLHGGPLKL